MLFSYNWLQSFFSQKLPEPRKLAEILTMHSFETEKPKKKGKDWVFDIDVLPNRASDCFSHIGIARELAVLLKSKIRIPKPKLKEDKKLKIKDFLKVEVKDKNACSRYSARMVFNVKVGPSPKWMQERLKICGLRPINNIVDIANYVMLETGQPLHAFDFEKIENATGSKVKTIIVRKAKQKEEIVTLDGKKYDLDNDVLVIADKKTPLAIAGIKGGKLAEIDKNTKIVVLEAANFNLHRIRKSSRKLNLKTDASWRFEHGIDPNLTEQALTRAASLIQEIAKGKIAKGMVDIYPKKVIPKKIRLNLDYVKSLLGTKISKKEIISILKRLEFRVKDLNSVLWVTIPTRRLDLSLPEDLIEEIGRIYGYENIAPKMPIVPIYPPKENKTLLWEKKIKEIMKAMGFTEVYLYSFISEKDKELFSISENSEGILKDWQLIEIKNPVSSNTKYLRPSLLPNLLKIVKENEKKKKRIKIFEIGKIYLKNPDKLPQQKVKERKMLVGIVSGRDKFYELKGATESLFEKLGIVDIFFDPFQIFPEESPLVFWEKNTSAEIRERQGDIKLGFLGRIKKEILDFYQITNEVYGFEIDFEKLIELAEEEHEYKAPSPYPEVIRDIAVLVPVKTLAGEVIEKIHLAGGNLIRDVEVFDIYQGAPLPPEKKNLAFHIIFQAQDRTLTSEEVDKIMKRITEELEKNVQWQVRQQ